MSASPLVGKEAVMAMPRRENPATQMLSVAVPAVLRTAAEQAAEARGVSLSAFARRAIAAAIVADAKGDEERPRDARR